MPIVNISTMKGALSGEQKEEMHKKVADLMVEIEGKGNEDFRKYVFIKIDEGNPENWSAGGRPASAEFVKKITQAASK